MANAIARLPFRAHLLRAGFPAEENAMFWIGVTIAVLIICLLTWVGAAMTHRGLPNNWERRGRGGFIPGPHGHDGYHDDYFP